MENENQEWQLVFPERGNFGLAYRVIVNNCVAFGWMNSSGMVDSALHYSTPVMSTEDLLKLKGKSDQTQQSSDGWTLINPEKSYGLVYKFDEDGDVMLAWLHAGTVRSLGMGNPEAIPVSDRKVFKEFAYKLWTNQLDKDIPFTLESAVKNYQRALNEHVGVAEARTRMFEILNG